jgi:lipopolysaccharide export system protein LptA
MKQPPDNLGARWLALAAVIAGLGAGGEAAAQPSLGTVSDFSTGEHYDPPHENQMRWVLRGQEAEPLTGGRYRIKRFALETFLTNGVRQLVVEAPECLYDQAQQTAGSSGPLQVQSGDGRVSISGEGFLWRQSTESLAVSNQVRATVRRDATHPAAPPLIITSRWFTLDATNHSAIFHDDVRGADAEMEFTCGKLAILAAPGGGPLEVIEAEQSPVILSKTDGRRAAGDRLVYNRAQDLVEVSGNATWQQGRQSGRADRTVMRRREQDFAADGHVALKLPREALGAGGGLLAGANTPATAAEAGAPPVDLFADHFQSRSNRFVAEGAVRLVDATNRLACDRLIVHSAATGHANGTALAEGRVLVERGDGQLRADRALYTQADAEVVFTGHPHWTQPQMEGRAERITLHRDTGRVHAEQQVAVKIQLAAQGPSALAFFPGAATTNRGPQVVEIFAREFTATNRLATFLGDVRAHESPRTGAEPRLRSDTLEVQLAADGPRAERITASHHVVFEQGAPGVTNGATVYRTLTARTLTATPSPRTNGVVDLVAEGEVELTEPGATAQCERAVYTGATDTVTLTGKPVLVVHVQGRPAAQRPPGILTVTDAEVLIWERARGRYSGKGCQVTFQPQAVKTADGK